MRLAVPTSEPDAQLGCLVRAFENAGSVAMSWAESFGAVLEQLPVLCSVNGKVWGISLIAIAFCGMPS